MPLISRNFHCVPLSNPQLESSRWTNGDLQSTPGPSIRRLLKGASVLRDVCTSPESIYRNFQQILQLCPENARTPMLITLESSLSGQNRGGSRSGPYLGLLGIFWVDLWCSDFALQFQVQGLLKEARVARI